MYSRWFHARDGKEGGCGLLLSDQPKIVSGSRKACISQVVGSVDSKLWPVKSKSPNIVILLEDGYTAAAGHKSR